MRNENLIKQLNLALAQLAAEGVGKDDRRYQEIRKKLDKLQKEKHKLNQGNLATTKDLLVIKEKPKVPEAANKIVTEDKDIYYFKNGIMVPKIIVERLITTSQGKSPYFVLASLCKFCNSKGVVKNRRVEDLAKWCGYEDSSTYRFGLNWLEENEFIIVDRSTRINTYIINDYIFKRAIVIPEADIKEDVKNVIPKELRVKWTYYFRNHHSPNNKEGKFDLSLTYLKKMTKAVSFKEVLKLVNNLKGSFFDSLELIKSNIKKAKHKLKIEFNKLKLGIINNLEEEIAKINHNEYFKRVCKAFNNLEIPLTLPGFRSAYRAIRKTGEYYLDKIVAKAKTGKYKSREKSVGYFIYLIEQEYMINN